MKNNDQNFIIYGVDIGSTQRDRFAWCRLDPTSDTTYCLSKTTSKGTEEIEPIDELVTSLKQDIENNLKIALGLEAPLYLPIPESAKGLSKGRDNEGNRSCMAQIGLSVAGLALHQLAFILRDLKNEIQSMPKITLDFDQWCKSKNNELLIWEAFVSGEAKKDKKTQISNGKKENPHEIDAEKAANAFLEYLTCPEKRTDENIFGQIRLNDRENTQKALSLAGTALLWSGLSTELELLHNKVLVIKPKK